MSRNIELTPDQVCGGCSKFEPSRDPKYGYCKSLMAYERERTLMPSARLLDVDHACIMARYENMTGHPSFTPRAAA